MTLMRLADVTGTRRLDRSPSEESGLLPPWARMG